MSNDDLELDIEKSLRQEKKIRRLKILIRIFATLVIFAFVTMFLIADYFKIKNIIIDGNFFVSDEMILKNANISIGDNYYLSYLKEIDKDIEKNDVIDNVIVSRNNNVINIEIVEEKVLFKSQKGYYFSSGSFTNQDSNYPAIDFINFEDSLDQDIIIDELSKLSNDNMEVFDFISQIRYTPVNLNEKRLVLFMRDGNQVTISPNQISEKMKYYFEVVDGIYTKKGLEVRGVLHFDLGSDFEPF